MRWPLAILGLLCVAGIAGIGFRLGSTRAGVLTGIVCLSFPLLSLQARQLTSEIGTPAGATLIVFGLTFALRPSAGRWMIADAIASAAALAIGAWLAFHSGGVLLGVVIPFGAVAIAGALGWPLVRRYLPVPAHTPPPDRETVRSDVAVGAIALAATVAAIVLCSILATQMYDMRDPIPGTRAVAEKSIVPSECWSTALGGLWKFEDDLTATYDVAFEQIAFGTFPWGLAAPIAIGFLLVSPRRERRFAGALALAWAAGSWLATVAFQRKVGFTIYAGFPAMALAIGLWLDDLLDRLASPAPGDDGPRIGLLAGLFVLLGALTLGKDLQTFPERLTSLLVGKDAIKYPKNAELLAIPVRAWVLGLGLAVTGTFAAALWVWRAGDDERAQRWRARSRILIAVSLLATIVTAWFWIHGWHRSLAKNLSSKQVFATYRDLAKDGDVLGIVGDMGNAPRYYADGPWEKIPGRDQLLTFLGREDRRVFALAPAADLCAIHRQAAGKKYYVLDDTNARWLLLSNRLDGASDRNPLAFAIRREEPPGIKHKPAGEVVWDDKIQLVGWDMPAKVDKRDDFQVTLYFKVLNPVGGTWKVFAHFDPPASARFQGDHAPINDRCQTAYWQKGDYIVDRFTVEAGDVSSPTGTYQVYVGFWPGSDRPRMRVSKAPPGGVDNDHRVKLGTIIVQ
jgi:hypothetical protein